MEITGRLTQDAIIRKLKDGRELVAFTIAINDRYRTKTGDIKTTATFFNCSYWLSTKVVGLLRKGGIVQLYGRVKATAFKTHDGEAKASLSFHVNNVQVISTTKPAETAVDDLSRQEPEEDLPF